ncbi:MAG: PhzF family phenazine biosynthesis protein [Bacteroidetes bacterium]|nr:PhzF family phenazine biosynthesis protein [Bacteroidota bacterium]
MKIKMYQVDAFTDKLFGGNPAAVCILDSWLSDSLMQSIAAENNLAETAYIVRNSAGYDIRWFTPAVEVDLCGHATLASAHVVFSYLGHTGNDVVFTSHRSGALSVTRTGALLTLNFPTDIYSKCDTPAALANGLGKAPIETWRGKTDYMAVYATEQDILNMHPDYTTLHQLDGRGVIVTAPGSDVDFVSRFFAPQSGIDEDPVTGSAHTTLTPYWSEVLGKNTLSAIQVSARRGYLHCEYLGARVAISGHAVTYMTAEIDV